MTVVHNGKKGLSMEEKKIYTVVYHLYHSLSHFLTISFGGFYQLILDTVQVSDVKEGE